MIKPIDFCIEVAESSSRFEKNNSELKKQYIIHNIELIKGIMSGIVGYEGCFGSGYPFYALEKDFFGNLPIIDEQIRYNNELINTAIISGYEEWECANCLNSKGYVMPDLKQVCYNCKNVIKELSPRKVINRLPDIDMWMIVDDKKIERAKLELQMKLLRKHMYPSDINPVQSMEEVIEIVNDLENNKMPKKTLPLDVHIIKYSDILSLVFNVPDVIFDSLDYNAIPFLPIHPVSLRKRWQYDDVPYNFILDFLFSFSPLETDKVLNRAINFSRKRIVEMLSKEELDNLLMLVAPDSVKRRFKNKTLKRCYEKRIESWKN